MDEQRQRVVPDACKQVYDRLARGAQLPHARALGDIAGGEHAASDVQGVDDAAL